MAGVRKTGGHGLGKQKIGKGSGKHGPKRAIRPAIMQMDVSRPAIRRLARRGGVKRMAGTIHEEARGVLQQFLAGVLQHSITNTEHARRKTVTELDVVYALKRDGKGIFR